MQAITTKYFGPGNVRGSRVKATCEAGTIFVPWDHALDVEANHDAAALALIRKLGWDTGNYGTWYRGGLPSRDGNVYVCAAPYARITVRADTLPVEAKQLDTQDFRGYLRNCTDAQVRGVYEKEKGAGRDVFADLARAEAEKRGVELD